MKTADVLLTLPGHHLYLDALAVLVLAALFWRFNLSHWAMESNRARAMRWRTRCHLRPGPGFATWPELVYQWGRLAASKRGGRARPGLAYRQRLLARPRHYAIRLGRAQWGKRVLGTMEANWLLLAPPRKGKSGALADWILDWPGAVIATSTRADLFMNTAGARSRRGVVHVFNPFGIGRVPSTFGWDPVAGCQDPAEAFTRADALIGPRVAGTGDMSFWQDKAALALSALLHAAALSGRTVLDIWDWANRSGDAIGGSALAHHPAASSVLRSVFAEATREGRSPDSIRMTMAKSLTWVAVPSVAAMVAGPAARPFDAARFAAARGTLYLVAPGTQGVVIEPLFRCFVDFAQRQATLAGSRTPAGKLDPPLLLALDEVRQIVRVPLDVWLADSAGKGVCIIAVAHGMGQLREGWGEDGAATIWDTTNKIILPGVQDRAVLEDVAAVCGQVGARDGDRRVQVQAVPPAFVSQLVRRRAFVLEGGSRPVVVKLRPVWARLSSRLRLAVAPPPLSACQELDLRFPNWKTRPRPGWTAPGPWTGCWNPPGHPTCPTGRSRTERRTIRRDRPQPARWRGPARGGAGPRRAPSPGGAGGRAPRRGGHPVRDAGRPGRLGGGPAEPGPFRPLRGGPLGPGVRQGHAGPGPPPDRHRGRHGRQSGRAWTRPSRTSRTAGPASARPTGPPWTRPPARPSWPGSPNG